MPVGRVHTPPVPPVPLFYVIIRIVSRLVFGGRVYNDYVGDRPVILSGIVGEHHQPHRGNLYAVYRTADAEPGRKLRAIDASPLCQALHYDIAYPMWKVIKDNVRSANGPIIARYVGDDRGMIGKTIYFGPFARVLNLKRDDMVICPASLTQQDPHRSRSSDFYLPKPLLEQVEVIRATPAATGASMATPVAAGGAAEPAPGPKKYEKRNGRWGLMGQGAPVAAGGAAEPAPAPAPADHPAATVGRSYAEDGCTAA